MDSFVDNCPIITIVIYFGWIFFINFKNPLYLILNQFSNEYQLSHKESSNSNLFFAEDLAVVTKPHKPNGITTNNSREKSHLRFILMNQLSFIKRRFFPGPLEEKSFPSS